jgi:hypothetical protein
VVALQLSNNNIEAAEVIMKKVLSRINEYEKHTHGSSKSITHHVGSFDDMDTETKVLKENESTRQRRGSWKGESKGTNGSSISTGIICEVCKDDNPLKKDQLLQCVGCSNSYHTHCVGAKKIPFGIKTLREKQNHDKYVSKYFGQWRCPSCTGSETQLLPEPHISQKRMSVGVDMEKSNERSFSSILPNFSQKWVPTLTSNGDVSYKKKDDDAETNSPEELKSHHDLTAMLIGLLATTGVTMENLMSMNEIQQKDALIFAANLHNSKNSTAFNKPITSANVADEIKGTVDSSSTSNKISSEVNVSILVNSTETEKHMDNNSLVKYVKMVKVS